MRVEGAKAKKNVSAVAYDITNLEYHQTVPGEEQKYSDDLGESLPSLLYLFKYLN